MIHHPARRADNDLRPLFQGQNLPVNRLATINGENPDTSLYLARACQRVGICTAVRASRQIMNWTRPLSIHPFDKGNAKGACLAGPVCADREILPGEIWGIASLESRCLLKAKVATAR
jgi:hypothetical protein